MKRDIRLNMSDLWEIYNKINIYRDALEDIASASANFLNALKNQDSKTYEKLSQVWEEKVQMQEGELSERLGSVGKILGDYMRDMEDCIMPKDECRLLRVDSNDIWWNYSQIANNVMDFWDILSDTGSSWKDYGGGYCYNPFLDEEENATRKAAKEAEEAAERGRRERNYRKLSDFRETLKGKTIEELPEYVKQIRDIYDKNVVSFEETDDLYKRKLEEIYTEWASFGERLTDVWNVVTDVGSGVIDGVGDLVVGTLNLLGGTLEILLWLEMHNSIADYFGLIPDFLEEDVQKIFDGAGAILEDPGNALEAMGQSVFDTADEEGIAYSVSYVTVDVVAEVLLTKGIGELKNINKAGKVANIAKDAADLAGDTARQSGKIGNVAEEVIEHADDVPVGGQGGNVGKGGTKTNIMDEVFDGTGAYSGKLEKVNSPDANADMLAERIGGESRVKFTNDPKAREFDAISNEYIAQAKPALSTLNKSVREQMKATFEAAKQTGKKVYYQFEGTPAQSVIDKLYEYSERYGVEVIIDINPLN